MIIPVNDLNLDEAARVHSASWKESHEAFCDEAFVKAHTPERQEKYLADKIENGWRVYMLVLENGEAVGIVSVKEDVIEDLYVLPERQNRGYGSELLKHAINLCDGVPTLWILENNAAAERLYVRMGFRATGRRNVITDGLDEIEFALYG